MTSEEILEQLRTLPSSEQFLVLESLAHDLRQQMGNNFDRKHVHDDLASAARALLADYQPGGELTAFTALDSEDFHATR